MFSFSFLCSAIPDLDLGIIKMLIRAMLFLVTMVTMIIT